VVTLYALIGADGHVKDALLGSTSGFQRLDNAALNIVKRFEYVPGQINGVPSPIWWPLTISFSFRGERALSCSAIPVITPYEKRPRVPSDSSLPRYSRWTLINAYGLTEESLLLTEKGWMSFTYTYVRGMAIAQRPPAGRPGARCWIYDGIDPMMDGWVTGL